MRRRLVLAAVVGTAAALTAALMAMTTSSATPGNASGAAAAIVPADTVAFVALDSNAGSAQWQTLAGLLAKIPSASTLVTTLNELQPALGPETDVALLPAASGKKPQAVVLTQPADATKLSALLQKLATQHPAAAKPLTTTVGGWTAISDSQAALDAVSGATSHLGDSSLYQEATGKLAGDAVATAYANGAEARQLVTTLGGSPPATSSQLVWAAADVVASGGGLEVHGFVRSQGGTATQPYAAALLQKIPSGQLLVADFQAHTTATATAKPTTPLGADLEKLRSALGGETALYVSPGAPIPAVTLVTQAADPQAVLDAIHQALADAGSAAGSTSGTSGLDLGKILGALTLSHEMVGSDLVVSTSQQQIAAFAGSGSKLADDATFKQAASAAGMPAETTGFVYANLKDMLPLAQGLASVAGGTLPKGLDLSGLQTLTAFGSGSQNGISSFTVFLGIG